MLKTAFSQKRNDTWNYKLLFSQPVFSLKQYSFIVRFELIFAFDRHDDFVTNAYDYKYRQSNKLNDIGFQNSY